MKKVKIFTHGSETVLEEYVNQFIAEHPISIIDIRYGVVWNPLVQSPRYSAMVIYNTSLDTIHDNACELREKLHDLFEGGESN